MSDDKLLRAVGHVAAQQTAERERWEASAVGGSASAGEDADLARRLFAPPTAESIDRMAARVTELLRTEGRPAAKVVPLRPRALRWARIAAAPLAAAAAIALLLLRPAGDLPRYTLDVSGGVREARSAAPALPTGPISVAPGTQLVLVARPDANSPGNVHAATFVLRAGEAAVVPSVSEASAKGALRITVQGDDLAKAAGPSGSVDVVLVVDRSADADRRALAASDGARGEWSRFTVPVRIVQAAR